MKNGKKWLVVLALVCFLLSSSACGDVSDASSDNPRDGVGTETSVEAESEALSESSESEVSGGQNQDSDSSQVDSRTALSASLPSTQTGGITLAEIPAYSGSPYTVINENVPYFTESDCTTEAFETYSELDSLGRCGVAYANICQELMPTEERGRIGEVKPTGWHLVKYEGIDGNYLYNRCHLIGFQLAGENANEKNLITGTRYLNVDGMLPYENLVADYVDETDNHVLYRVTPFFDGDNLVASGVLMEGWSVEDDGSGICFNVYCYNVQPGIGIDYATGDSWTDSTIVSSENTSGVVNGRVAASSGAGLTSNSSSTGNGSSDGAAETGESSDTDAGTAQTGNDNVSSTESENEMTYILNTNTKKFHYPSCSSVSQMKDTNKEEYTGTRGEVIDMGYEPCGNCNP